MASDDFAIVVGISTYPGFSSLGSPEYDATEFKKWLLSPEGGDVPKDNITAILSSDFEPPAADVDKAQPTLQAVDAAFMKLVRNAYVKKNYRVGRRLYIYFSGHGITPGLAPVPDLDDSALLMANADDKSLGLHVPGHPYAEWFRNASAFDEIVLFMDCCRDYMDKVIPRYPPFNSLQGNPAGVRRFYATAANWNSSAWEGYLQPANQKRSYFSFALLEALNGTLCDAEGNLTGNLLAGYVPGRVNELRAGKPGQDPHFSYEPQQDLVIVKRKKTNTQTLQVTFAGQYRGQTAKLLGPTLQTLNTWQVNGQPWETNISPGMYMITCGATEMPFAVRAGESKKVVQFG
jgi:hypothetical protein